jgi:hypothetical protein
MKFHRYARLYHRMAELDFQALVASIRAHGLRHAIVVDEDRCSSYRAAYRALKSVFWSP